MQIALSNRFTALWRDPVGGPPKPSRSYTGCRSEGRSTLGVQTPQGNAIVPHKAIDSTCESWYGVTVAPEVKSRSTAAAAASTP